MISSVSRLTVLICSMGREVTATSEAPVGSRMNQKMNRQPKLALSETTDNEPNGGSDGCNQGPHSHHETDLAFWDYITKMM